MSFGNTLLDLITGVVGGTLFLAFVIAAIFCGLSSLLKLSNENRNLFKKISKGCSFVILGFGLLLIFRKLWFAFFLTVWWFCLMNEIFPTQRLLQAGIAVLLSFVYWVRHIAKSRAIFLLNIGDFTLFVILPLVIVVVQLSRGSDQLTGNSGPKIPLHNVLGMLSEMLETIFPVYNN